MQQAEDRLVCFPHIHMVYNIYNVPVFVAFCACTLTCLLPCRLTLPDNTSKYVTNPGALLVTKFAYRHLQVNQVGPWGYYVTIEVLITIVFGQDILQTASDENGHSFASA